MVRPGDHLVLRAGLVVAILATVVLATMQTVRYVNYGELRYWGYKVERDERLAVPDHFPFAKLSDLALDKECQARFVKPALSLALSALDGTDALLENAARGKALERAKDLALHALWCHPSSGNLWLRFAMIEYAQTKSSASIARFLRLSQLYSPAERNVVQGRYAQYVRLSDEELPPVSYPLERDLMTICSSVMGWRSRTALPRPGPAIFSAINNIVPKCPPVGAQS